MVTPHPPWERKPPRSRQKATLTEAQKQEARERAEANGRRYPNLIDNMYVTRKAKQQGEAQTFPRDRGHKP